MSKSIADQLVELAAQLESRAGEIAKEQALNIKSAEGAHKEARVAWAELDKRNAEIRRLQCELDAAVEHCESKSREIADLRAKLDKAEGWVEWNGGACPVEKTAQVYVRLRDDVATQCGPLNAGTWGWDHDGDLADIIAYRLAEPAADPERPKTWRLLLDTLKRQGEELKRKDSVIAVVTSNRDHYRRLAANGENRIRQLEANLEGEKALSAARGKEIERLRNPIRLTFGDGGITFYDNYGEIKAMGYLDAADGDGATMFDMLGK